MLSSGDLALLRPDLEHVALDVRQVIETPRNAISHVYFVKSGLVSVVGAQRDHSIEVGMVGYEGMTGLSVVLGDHQPANQTLVQSPGAALRISSRCLRQAMSASPTLSATLLRYVQVFMTQATHTALANGRGLLNERLARWLLMWQDRLQDQNITVTHEFLSLLLGVRRQGVTLALHELEGEGLIKSSRSLVRIVDRAGLCLAATGSTACPKLNTND